MPILLDLYLTFFLLGATSFGGGYAMLPILERVIAQKKGWASEEELADYFAIGQCTPGVISVNVATFIGMKYQGIKGAIIATLGLVSPCIVIISAIATLFSAAATNQTLTHGFNGLKVCVAILIAGSAWTLVKKSIVDPTTGRIFYLVFSATLLGKLYPNLPPFLQPFTSPITLVVLAGFTGYLCEKNQNKSEQ